MTIGNTAVANSPVASDARLDPGFLKYEITAEYDLEYSVLGRYRLGLNGDGTYD